MHGGGQTDRRSLNHIAGCLLGGAVGDALGASIEFLTLDEIRVQFGPDGVTDYTSAYSPIGAITDDTQMTLFTAEGLIRAFNRLSARGIGHTPSIVYRAYLRWLVTQGERPPYTDPDLRKSWLLDLPALHHRRAPGNTCLSALRSGRLGTIKDPINNSKGCGGVMRVAPVGLSQTSVPFELGAEIAAITHGHPSGYLAAGFLAAVIDAIIAGSSLQDAIVFATDELRRWDHHEECLTAVEAAQQLAADGPATPERVEQLGEGWVAEEALAIALYCALTADGSFEHGVLSAVNHSGDSDSTGAIVGNILGALLGLRAIPDRWLDRLELRDEIHQLAQDLTDYFVDLDRAPDPEDDWHRYPGI